MTITSVGYEGDINEAQWAELTPILGTPYAIVGSEDWAVTAVAGQDRTITIAPGVGWGYGVRVDSSAPESIQLSPIVSGTRWDLIACNRDWTPAGGGISTFVAREGTNVQAIPSTRLSGPGVSDDQPIALVQVTAGQTLPTAIVPLRTWASKVLTADSLLAVPDAPYGTEVVVDGVRYRRVKDASGSVAWKLDQDDTGWLSGAALPFDFGTGWADAGSRVRRRGGMVEAFIAARRTGSNLTAGEVSGGFTDTSIGFFDQGYKPPSHNVPMAAWYSTTIGTYGCAGLIGPSGNTIIMSGSSAVDLNKNDTFWGQGTFML